MSSVALDLEVLPKLYIEMRHIDTLVPYDRNARTHSDEQIEQVVASMLQFGWTNPELIDERGGIIAGHARLAAAKRIYSRGQRIKTPSGELIPDHMIPVIDCKGWTDAQKRAYVLADNQLALNAAWDAALLATELRDLKLEGFDLSLTGFATAEIDELFAGEPPEVAADVPKNEEAERLLNAAWRNWRKDCLAGHAALKPLATVSVGLSRNAAKIYFLQALYYRRRFPQFATLAYHPQRLAVAGDSFSLLDYLSGEQFKDERIRFLLGDTPSWDRLIRSGLPIAGCRIPLDFPAELATSLIDEFCPAEGRVLDPCHGWGGRVVGFYLSRASRYVGFDPSPDANAGVAALIRDFGSYVPAKKAATRCQCFEDAKFKEGTVDFALTSPPYYDVEKYTGAEQSHARYSNYGEWNAKFYRVMIERVHAALKPGAVFALQVGNQHYPLERDAVEHAERIGFAHVETRNAAIPNHQFDTPDGEGEVIVVLRKGER